MNIEYLFILFLETISLLYKNDCPTEYDIDKTIVYKYNEYDDEKIS